LSFIYPTETRLAGLPVHDVRTGALPRRAADLIVCVRRIDASATLTGAQIALSV
jgi:hypothetical protein